MKYFYHLFFIILLVLFSCSKVKKGQEISNNSDSKKINSERIITSIGETLIPKAKEAVSDWKEYKDVDEFILKYFSITPMEALQNSNELADLIKLMKDSIRVSKLKNPNIIARINVLHNEALRLADMASITTISDGEVKEEVLKIAEIYSAYNAKINTIIKADEFQNSLEIDTEKPILIEKKIQKPKVQYSKKIGKPIKVLR